ncbi:MAG: LuxR C-terminal-related transcriptional regulator [Phycisphaerales bacterium]|nr:LuxR C-terminal-related transcriptional regulator [Phycisphaerales bacterium]
MTRPHEQPGAEEQRSRAAFIAAHERLHAWTLRLFMQRTGSRRAVAEDLAQRTWHAAWKAVSTGVYDPSRASMTTFIHGVAQTIARGAATEFARAANRKPPEPVGWGASESADLSKLVEQAEMVDRVRAALRGDAPGAGLTPDEIGVLQLVSRGVGDRELAKQLGVAPSTANARKRSAMQKLAGYLESGRVPKGVGPGDAGNLPDEAERVRPVRQ